MPPYPYQTLADLPAAQVDQYDHHERRAFLEAFNHAWEEYGHDESRAHRVAWGAVKQKYHKNESGDWVEGASEDD